MGLLARGERYGYQLRAELEEEFGPEWRIDFGQLYRQLASMTRKGWLRVRLVRGTRGPDRKLYALTPSGRNELRRWLRQPATESVRGRDEFPVKLRLGMDARTPATGDLVAERRRRLETQRQAEHVRAARAQREGDVGRWLVAETRRHQTEGALAALDSCAGVSRPRRSGSLSTSPSEPLLATGSDDLVLDLIARHLTHEHPEIRFSASPVGSLAGLIALGEGRAHLAGIHLLDVDSGEYNVPFVKHLMPEEPVVLVNLAHREQGLMVAPGNPKGIRHLRDLVRPGVELINRQRGAGTRLLLFQRLRQARIDPSAIRGYAREATTHGSVAAAVKAGTADAGPGIRAVTEAWGLEFLPLGHERYDLVIPRRIFDSPRLRPLLELIHQQAFRRAAAAFSGYDVSHMSEIVAIH